MKRSVLTFLLLICLTLTALPAWADTVKESARSVPVAYDVDVVVVGGATAGVAAAVEAAQAGADVFLAAPRPYLGEDICGTYRLWLGPDEEPPTELTRRMFAEPPMLKGIGKSAPFTYRTDIPSSGVHKDTTPPSMLGDGKATSAYKQSVEYGGDVTITLDLGKRISLARVHVLAFQRRNDIEVESVTILAGDDKQRWTKAGFARNEQLGATEYVDKALCMSASVKVTTRYLRIVARKTENVERLLLGEIVVEPAGEVALPEAAEKALTPPTPMQVKRALDDALLDAGVRFLYGCFATDVLRDADGRLAGIVMANRSGRQAVRARVIIDATHRATVARMAGAEFKPYPGGVRVFRRVVIGGEIRTGEGVKGRKKPTPVQIERSAVSADASRHAIEYELSIPMKDASYASFAKADHLARDKTWHPGQVDASEVLFQVPPDPMKSKKAQAGAWPGAAKIDLDAFRPAGQPGLYVLGGCADMSRQAAAKLLGPLEFMAVGRRIGREAAKDVDARPKSRIVCFGDSITAGAYPARLGRILNGYRVINAGVGGNTSTQGVARLDKDVLGCKPRAVVVLFGTNDSVLTGPKKYRTPLDTFEANLVKIVERCGRAGAKVVLCSVPPIIAGPYFTRHTKAHYDAEGGLDQIIERYRSAAIRVGRTMSVPVIDLFELLPKDHRSLRSCGVHPTVKGERTIAALVAKALVPLLGPVPKTRPAPKGVRVVGRKGDASVGGEVREVLVGVRPTQRNLPTVPSEPRLLDVLGRYDVVVVGGGTGGAPAGISAARQGGKTLVLEFLHGLGGVGTLGLIGKYYHGYRKGFTAEIDRGVAALGGQDRPANPAWQIEWKMEWYRRELRKAGADVWFGTLGCGALVEGGRVKGVVVATPHGRGVVLADVVIDSTGNSDIAITAGASCIYTDGSHVAVQGTGLPPRKPGAFYTNTDYTLTDDADIVDMWRSYVVARAKFGKAYDLGQIIDTRERRRIVGDFVISPLDIFNGRTFPDTVVMSQSNFDTHGYTVHPLYALKVPDKKGVSAYTPYRCLIPKGLDGILVTGLGISAHRDAMPILRMQPDIQNQGYAAGMAAMMVVRYGGGTREIDIKALQKHLVEKGNLPKNVLTDKDSFPVSQETLARAVTSVAKGYEGIGIILAQAEDAMPLLRRAYASAKSKDAKLVYAHILGMLGDASGSDMLVRSVQALEWDAGWTFTGGGQFGGSLSPLDSLIIALGSTRDRRAIEPILAKVGKLGPESEFSHHRAVAVALETVGDPRAAKPLAELLGKPGMTGYALTDIGDAKRSAKNANPNQSRDRSLRELILARALYRCGDHEGIGKEILEAYRRDFRGHHSRHAHAVLAAGRK